MRQPRVGQMAVLIWKLDDEGVADWEYVVVESIYDDEIVFLKENGGRYLHHNYSNDDDAKVMRDQRVKSTLRYLHRGGSPIFSKKSILGDFTFKPKL